MVAVAKTLPLLSVSVVPFTYDEVSDLEFCQKMLNSLCIFHDVNGISDVDVASVCRKLISRPWRSNSASSKGGFKAGKDERCRCTKPGVTV